MNNSGSRIDLSSQSEPESAISSHIEINWTIDFESKYIKGCATHSVVVVKDQVTHVHFDSNGLVFEPQAILISEEGSAEEIVNVILGPSSCLGYNFISIPIVYATKRFIILLNYIISTKTKAKEYLSRFPRACVELEVNSVSDLTTRRKHLPLRFNGSRLQVPLGR
jgi:hypothetical protein